MTFIINSAQNSIDDMNKSTLGDEFSSPHFISKGEEKWKRKILKD
mgnify:CR=1 FL=1|jgi:hypothetical protein